MEPDWVSAAVFLAVVGVVALAYVGLCVALARRASSSTPFSSAGTAPSPAEAAEMPFSWLLPSVVALVLAFTPFAVASIVHASRVAPLHRMGELVAARESARRARIWFWWSVVVGAAVIGGTMVAPWVIVRLLRIEI
jgi:hypothetical protein